MQLGMILETNDPEKVRNAFRLANTAPDASHHVETFLLGDGVEAPDLEHEKFNPHGVMLKYANGGLSLRLRHPYGLAGYRARRSQAPVHDG